MKTVVTVLAIAALCICAWAAGNAVVGTRPTANHQSPTAERQSLDAITIPQMLSYQGKLTDTVGIPVNDTTYPVTFRLYTVPTGGASFWNETQTVRTHGGLFATLLGSVAQIESVPSSGSLYLGMAVAGGAEMSPRLRLVGSAYSYLAGKSANADLLQGKDTTALDSRYVNEGQATSVTSNMIVNGTIAAVDLNQMGASSGQVMKWTGSAWAPRNDSIGSGGTGTVTSVGQATGVVCTPNPITTTGTVRFDSTWGDARFVNEGQANSITGAMITDGQVSSADIRDTTVTTADLKDGSVTSAKILLPYSGSVATGSDAFGVTNTLTSNDAAAIIGTHDVTDYYGIGVAGVGGYEGINGSVTPTGSSSYAGVHGYVNGGSGSNCGVQGYASGTGTKYGVSGEANGTGTNYGVYGIASGGTNYGGYFDGGVYGSSAASSWLGSIGVNTNATGTGGMGTGNNTGGSRLSAGSGLAGTGTQYGVYGRANDTASCSGGYFANGHGSYAYVAYYTGGTNYKIAGSGTVSTIMETREGKKALFAPEMPEAYFEDCGEGQLSNGHCRVNLEKLFSDCITVNAEHPLKVFVQLEDDCNGVYVNKDATGFDVRELQGGKSNAHFSWRALAKWQGNENVRLPEAPEPLPTTAVERQVPVEGKTTTATQPRPAPGLK